MSSYFTKIVDYFKEKINGKERKKLIENTVIIIIIGVIILIAGSSFFSKGNKGITDEKPGEENNTIAVNKNVDEDSYTKIEDKLEIFLSKIYGVGKANVMITYVSGKELIPAYDKKSNNTDTIEKDNQGGSRSTKQINDEESIVFIEEQGVKKPIIIKDIEPVVKGVIVVADGANDLEVRENIIKAVQTIMDIPIHRIQVFSSSK